MGINTLVSFSQQALMLSLAVVLPVLAVAAVIGLVMAVLQAATQVQDPTLAHLPRVVAVAAALAVFGPWMGREIAAFAIRAFSGG
jgi:type III secretion HrpO family protein